ncbi:MAG: radical SAM protein [Chloroflexi bacterium]|nr:radical SAM protein [Chloroflexota bacterium]
MDTMVLLVGDSRCDKDDDCACLHNLAGVSKQVKVEGLRLHAGGDALRGVSLTSQFQLFAYLGGNGHVAVMGPPGQQVLNAFASPSTATDAIRNLKDFSKEQATTIVRKLVSLGFLQPVSHDCACTAEEDCGPVSSPLTSWLHLTDRCNLRCDYCYLPHVREDMSSETGRAAMDATFRSALANGFKQVKVKYAGGEPLLRFPLIVELHQYAQSLAHRHGIELEGVALSNGTLLTVEMVEAFKSLGVRLMISLDGLGAHHDLHRRYAGGRGSFVDVAEAVDLALVNGLTPNISVTVSGRTAVGLPDVMAWILERELPFSLNFYRENELSAAHGDMRLEEQKIIEGMSAAFKVIENNLPRRPFLGGIIDRANLSASHTHTCGVGQNYLVFDQNGQVAKCQMHICKPVTDMNAADPLAVIRLDQAGVQNISVDEKEGCKSCEWKYWCAGGCPLETYRATGRYDVQSPNCNIYKALFPEALRLEGLRLLKYQDDPEVVQKIVA